MKTPGNPFAPNTEEADEWERENEDDGHFVCYNCGEYCEPEEGNGELCDDCNADEEREVYGD